MKRSILRRFALFSAVAFAIAIVISTAVGLWQSTRRIEALYDYEASAIVDEARDLFANTTYEDVVASKDTAEYESMRHELRESCMAFDAQYLSLYEVDPQTGVRTFLYCVAEQDKDDEVVREQRSFGAQSKEPLSIQEQEAIAGNASSSVEFIQNEFGFTASRYFPLNIAGSKRPLVLGVDFDASKEQMEILDHAISFTAPLAFSMLLIVLLELFLLKKSVSDPLRSLSVRMRNFVKTGAHSQEVVESKTAEIADIETSFSTMTDDIENYVERIATMSEASAAAATELEVARHIQHGLVPPTTHCTSDGFDAFAFERSAREVGGDFYDLIELDDGRLLCVLGDVSGKGVSAALFMSMFRARLHDSLVQTTDPARSLNEVNDSVSNTNPENMFVTVIAAVYDPLTRVLTYANAGHTQPLLLDGTFLKPDPAIALGLFEGLDIKNETISLKSGEGVLLYTDGATEARNKESEFFGEERLMRTMHNNKDAKEVVDAVVNEVDSFVGNQEQFDDLTLLALVATKQRPKHWQATLDPKLSSFAIVRDHVIKLCGQGPWAKNALLACDESFSNVVNYSEATFVDVELRLLDEKLEIRLSDDGVPFDPLSHQQEKSSFENMDLGGMGIMFVKQVTDDVAYEYAGGKNILTLTFNR